MKYSVRQEAALWICEECGSWWCSQPALAPTDFLRQLPTSLASRLSWDNFRGWAIGSSEQIAVCRECGTVSSAPAYGVVGAASRRQPMFTLYAAPGMSVRNMRSVPAG